jgi:acyl-CoA synthetase (AMP-forming)/AMP-acid ligase II
LDLDLDQVRDREVLNIAAHLSLMARTRPYAPAVICPAGRDPAGRLCTTHWTFRQLDRETDTLARGLDAHGIGAGVRAALMVPPSLEFFALVFALFKAGAIPVLIDPGIGVKNLGRCLAEAAPAAFLGSPKAQWARRVLGWGRKSIRRRVTVGSGSRSGRGGGGGAGGLSLARLRRDGASDSDAPYPIAPIHGEETAAILFTSGSTGPPKGVVYSHANFAAQVASLRTLYAIEPGEIDLCTFPLFALFAPALGMTAVIPEMDATRPGQVDPTRVFEAVEAFGVTNLFGSPALLRRVSEHPAAQGVLLPSLRRVISAGAPVPARVLETFAALLSPRVPIFTPYGATEALPVSSIDSIEILGSTRQETDRGAGICVGKPAAGVRVKIIQISDEPIPEWSDDLIAPFGQIGEIVVQGPIVTRAYFRRPEETALAKIADPRAGEGQFWHRMGDLGYRDAQGRIWFCGRKSQRVTTPEGTLFTIPCEAVFNTHASVARTALVGIGAPGQMRPVLCVEPRSWIKSQADREQLRQALLELGATRHHTRTIQDLLFHPGFPVDTRHNAKIGREKLAEWAARKLPS